MVFTLTHKDGTARVGKLTTAHGEIETPFFMPAATRATGKFITSDDYTALGIPALICNAFLLSLKPGMELIRKAGGVHRFMNFSGIIFTDCGGFQMSRNIFEMKSKKGLHFRSPYDNSKIVITPKKIMEIEMALGSDVAMMLDDMSPYGVSFAEAKEALENTHRWGKESLQVHQQLRQEKRSQQLLFGIVQGNFYPELRKESARYINSLPFDGIAIGGVAIGEPLEKMYEAVDAALPFIDEKRPRYVMGVGSPKELLELISRGIDCFDSVYPTKMARHGHLFTRQGPLYLRKTIFQNDFSPIEQGCECPTCARFTRAYVHHLMKVEESTAKRLLSLHNLYFVRKLLEEAKKAIKEKKFAQFKERFLQGWESSPREDS